MITSCFSLISHTTEVSGQQEDNGNMIGKHIPNTMRSFKSVFPCDAELKRSRFVQSLLCCRSIPSGS
eukprot:166295-Hanusia_phi.AAC.1